MQQQASLGADILNLNLSCFFALSTKDFDQSCIYKMEIATLYAMTVVKMKDAKIDLSAQNNSNYYY